MVKINEIIDALSKEYRTGLQNKNILEKEIRDIELKLKDVNITHKEFLDLSENLKVKQIKVSSLNNYNTGVHNSREIVMTFLKENDFE